MHLAPRRHALLMPHGPKSPRLVARVSVRVRREGGSLSMTIPRYIARHWKLEPGARLIVRSTQEGILLYPRYFLPYSRSASRSARTRTETGPPATAGAAPRAR
jgi:antitoxin component of MazEF toxin-antitoxin module